MNSPNAAIFSIVKHCQSQIIVLGIHTAFARESAGIHEMTGSDSQNIAARRKCLQQPARSKRGDGRAFEDWAAPRSLHALENGHEVISDIG